MLPFSSDIRLHAHRAPQASRLRHAFRHAPARMRQRTLRQTCAAASADYYSVLGVARDASAKDIKSAFRRRALKLHPDVNKAADAKEQFMAAKEAFQVLSDAQQRASYDRQSQGGSRGFDWGNPFGSSSGGSSSSSRQRSGGKQKEEEPFYGFGALFSDLEREWGERRKRRQKEPASLWEELADLGEEFVEFLESELGIPPLEAEAAAQNSTSSSRQAAAEAAAAARRDAEAARQTARRGTDSAASGSQSQAKQAAEDVEDMLAELKRKMKM